MLGKKKKDHIILEIANGWHGPLRKRPISADAHIVSHPMPSPLTKCSMACMGRGPALMHLFQLKKNYLCIYLFWRFLRLEIRTLG